MRIFLLVSLLMLVSCNGGGGGGSSSPVVLDSRLFEGSATWERNYMPGGGGSISEDITFIGDECHMTVTTFDNAAAILGVDNIVLKMTPVRSDFAYGVNVADSSDVYAWTYSFVGNQLLLCNGGCIAFDKVP